MGLEGKVAVVTGASSGIGRGSSVVFARHGADVVVADINEEGAKETAAEIERLGRKALVVRTDVSRRSELEALVDESIDWQGHVDLFYSNAGVGVSGPPHRIPLADWEWIVGINLWPHVWVLPKILPHMLERGSGHLVHTASAAGLMGFPTMTPYAMTKFAVVGLCESLAMYVKGRGVSVHVVCPMFVNTNIFEGSRATLEEGMTEEEAERMREVFIRVMRQTGIPPEQVGESILEAIDAGRLYILPHPEVRDIVRTKWQDPDAWLEQASIAFTEQQQAMLQMLETPRGS